jgi:hypothetical protein
MLNVRWRFVAILLGGAFLLAACDDNNNKGQPTVVETPTSDDSDSGSGNGADDAELREAIDRFVGSTYRAEYELTGTGADGLGQMTMFKDGRDRLRFDVSSDVEGEAFDGSFIINGQDAVFCAEGDAFAEIPGIDASAGGVCFRTAADDETNPFAGIEDIFGDLENEDLTLLDKSEKEVAGEDTTCYRMRSAEGDVSTACLNDDGVLLETTDEADGGSTMRATSFSNDVSDGDFDPPYEVQELPTFGG